jgi:hypothetical protein
VLHTLQFRTTEVLDNVLPVWWVIISSQVRLQFTTENLQCGTLSNTVSSDQTKNLTRSWHRKSVKLEAVGRVSVSDLGFEVGRQVDDADGSEWTFLWADTATNTQAL